MAAAGKLVGIPLLFWQTLQPTAARFAPQLNDPTLLRWLLIALFLVLHLIMKGKILKIYSECAPAVFLVGSVLNAVSSDQSGSVFVIAGACLVIFAGKAVGSDYDRRVLGVRRVDVYHYLLSLALYSIARGAAPGIFV